MPNQNDLSMFLEISNRTENSADIYIYDYIGNFYGDYSAKDLLKEIEGLKDVKLNVHINSGGGDVYQGMAIYNILKNHRGGCNVFIDGIAASIASVIAMAGDTITMPSNAMMMIHKPMMMAWGNSDEMVQAAEYLDKVQDVIEATYLDRTGLSKAKIRSMVNKETWMDSQEASHLGFVDSVSQSVDMAASLEKCNLSMYTDIPEAFAKIKKDVTINSQREILPKPKSIDKKEQPKMSEEQKFDKSEVANMIAEAVNAAKAEFTAETAKIKEEASEQRTASIKAQLDSLVAKGSLTPANKESLEGMIDKVDHEEIFKLADQFASQNNMLQEQVNANGAAASSQAKPSEMAKVEIPEGVDARSFVLDAFAKKLVKDGTYSNYTDACMSTEKDMKAEFEAALALNEVKED